MARTAATIGGALKRDLDLCREIMLQVEEADGPIYDSELETCASEAAKRYHIELLESRGFIDAVVSKPGDGAAFKARIDGLTWDGRDFLDSVRDSRVWRNVRRAIRDSVGTATFDVVRSVASAVAVEMAKSCIGQK